MYTINFRNYFEKISQISYYFADSFFIMYEITETNFIERQSLITKIIKSSGWNFLNVMVAIRFDKERYIELWQIDFTKRGKHCRDFKIHLVTKYQDDKFLKIPRAKRFLQKINHSKCVVKVLLWKDNSQIFIGQNIFLLLSEILNFTLQIEFKDVSLFRNKNDFFVEMLQNKSILSTSNFCNFRPPKGVSVGSPFMIVNMIPVFGPRKSLTLTSMTVKPLDKYSQTLVFILHFSIWIMLIVFAKQNSNDKIDTFFKIHGTFHGFPFQIPTNMKAPIILLMFIGMMIKTFYSSNIYKVLTLNLFDNHPSNLKELQSSKYKILYSYLKTRFPGLFEYLKRSQFNMVFTNQTDAEILRSIHEIPDDTGAFLDQFKVFYYLERGMINPRIHIIFETVINIQKCLFYQENHFLKPLFEHYLDIFKETGFISKWSTVNLRKVKFEINKIPTQIFLNDVLQPFKFLNYGLVMSLCFLLWKYYITSEKFLE